MQDVPKLCRNKIVQMSLQFQQQLLKPFSNVPSKQKVSSPAPGRIYGQPGSLTSNQHCSNMNLKSLNKSQIEVATSIKIFKCLILKETEFGSFNFVDPPPAHSTSRNCSQFQQSTRDLHTKSPYAIISHSLGSHLSILTSTTTNATDPSASMPLDLGISGRCLNAVPKQKQQPNESEALNKMYNLSVPTTTVLNKSGSNLHILSTAKNATDPKIRLSTNATNSHINTMKMRLDDDLSMDSGNRSENSVSNGNDDSTVNETVIKQNYVANIQEIAAIIRSPGINARAEQFRSSSTTSSPASSPNLAVCVNTTQAQVCTDYEKSSAQGEKAIIHPLFGQKKT